MGGFCFVFGFILLVVCGISLFILLVMMVMVKSWGVISWWIWLINVFLVVCGNLVGIVCFSLLIWFFGLVMSENVMWGVVVLYCVEGKMYYIFIEFVSFGIMCNLMVCLVFWMSYCGCLLCDKIVVMILFIILFVVSGFEYCIVNLFVILFVIVICYFVFFFFW